MIKMVPRGFTGIEMTHVETTILFENHPRANMNRMFHDKPTLLKSTRKVDLSGIQTHIFGLPDSRFTN